MLLHVLMNLKYWRIKIKRVVAYELASSIQFEMIHEYH